MKKLIVIALISLVFTQCSWIEHQKMQIPPALSSTNLRASMTFPLITPQAKSLLKTKTKTYTIVFKPSQHQTPEQTFHVQWKSDDRLDVIATFLQDIAPGESLPVHGVVVHKVSVTTGDNTTYELAFAVSKTGTQSVSENGTSQEMIFQHIFPSKLKILENGQPVGYITIRDIGVSDLKVDVIFNKRVWSATLQSFLNQTRFLIQGPKGPIAFFELKPGKKLISSTDDGEIYFRTGTPKEDQNAAVLSYIFSYALFWANNHE